MNRFSMAQSLEFTAFCGPIVMISRVWCRGGGLGISTC
uniref:Uncharacterized protein n=1 Tax=Anguilla anguilla TaxID=7936 RepID=A0A0E9QFT8_ANGAN